MPLSREQLMAHLDKKFNKYEEAATGNQLDFSKPADPLTWGETAKAAGAGLLSAPAWAPRFAGEAGFAAAKVGQGLASGFGLFPNRLSEGLGRQAEASSEAGQYLASDVENKMGVYDSFGAKREQARAAGRMTQDIASSFLAPVGGAAKGGALGAKLGAKALGWAGAPAGRVGATVGRGAAFGALAGGEYGALGGAYSAAKEGKNVLGGAITGGAQGALGGAIMGGALPALGKLGRVALTPVEGALGRAEEGARGLFNRAASAVGKDEASMVGVQPTVFGKVAKAEGIAAENANVAAMRSQPVFGKRGDGMKVDVGGAAKLDEADVIMTQQQEAEISDALSGRGMKDDATKKTVFELIRPSVGGGAMTKPGQHKKLVDDTIDGIRYVHERTGKLSEPGKAGIEMFEKSETALRDVGKQLGAAIEAVGGTVPTNRVTARLDEWASTPQGKAMLTYDTEAASDFNRLKQILSDAPSMTPTELQAAKTELQRQAQQFFKTGKGSPVNAMAADEMNKVIDEAVMASTGQGTAALRKEYAAIKQLQQSLGRRLTVYMRQVDSGLMDQLAAAVTPETMVSAMLSGGLTAGSALANAAKNMAKWYNNPNRLMARLYDKVGGSYEKAAGKPALTGKTPAPAELATPKSGPRVDSFPKKTQAQLDAAEASASLRAGKNVKKGDIGGGAGGQYDDAGNLVMDAEGNHNVKLYHGTGKKFDDFDLAHVGSGEGSSLFGKGVYMTDNPNIAEKYAQIAGKKNHVEKYVDAGSFGDVEAVYKKGADELGKKDAVVMERAFNGKLLDISKYEPKPGDPIVEKIVDLMGNSGLSRAENEAFMKKIIDFADNSSASVRDYRGKLDFILRRSPLTPADKMKLVEFLQSKGYKGIKFRSDAAFDADKGSNYMIFDPKDLKSSTPRIGKATDKLDSAPVLGKVSADANVSAVNLKKDFEGLNSYAAKRPHVADQRRLLPEGPLADFLEDTKAWRKKYPQGGTDDASEAASVAASDALEKAGFSSDGVAKLTYSNKEAEDFLSIVAKSQRGDKVSEDAYDAAYEAMISKGWTREQLNQLSAGLIPNDLVSKDYALSMAEGFRKNSIDAAFKLMGKKNLTVDDIEKIYAAAKEFNATNDLGPDITASDLWKYFEKNKGAAKLGKVEASKPVVGKVDAPAAVKPKPAKIGKADIAASERAAKNNAQRLQDLGMEHDGLNTTRAHDGDIMTMKTIESDIKNDLRKMPFRELAALENPESMYLEKALKEEFRRRGIDYPEAPKAQGASTVKTGPKPDVPRIISENKVQKVQDLGMEYDGLDDARPTESKMLSMRSVESDMKKALSELTDRELASFEPESMYLEKALKAEFKRRGLTIPATFGPI